MLDDEVLSGQIPCRIRCLSLQRIRPSPTYRSARKSGPRCVKRSAPAISAAAISAAAIFGIASITTSVLATVQNIAKAGNRSVSLYPLDKGSCYLRRHYADGQYGEDGDDPHHPDAEAHLHLLHPPPVISMISPICRKAENIDSFVSPLRPSTLGRTAANIRAATESTITSTMTTFIGVDICPTRGRRIANHTPAYRRRTHPD